MHAIGLLLLAIPSQAPPVQASDAAALPVSDTDLASWVDRRVQDWQPRVDERRFDEIGWAKDVRDALRLAKVNQRPVFLFTHDGRMATGRC